MEKRSLIGKVFGRLTVLRQERSTGRSRCACLCTCGKTHDVRVDHLLSGRTSSCGCWHDEAAKLNGTTHGGRRTVEYRAWNLMVDRCTRAANKSFGDYGGRGVTICDRWRHDFAAFLADMGPRPSPSHSVERNDVNGNYEPSNCRWATRTEQARNKRNSRFIEVNGRRVTLAEWGEITGLGMKTLHARLAAGWPDAEAVLTPKLATGTRRAA